MKSEKEIREEIEATKRTIENYIKLVETGKMPFDTIHDNVIDCSATICALKWVLDENDRYD